MRNDRLLDSIVYIGGVCFVIFLWTYIHKTYNSPKIPESVKIVESFDDCDIIKYQDSQNQNHYFLKCK
jgi:hypothetical protein